MKIGIDIRNIGKKRTGDEVVFLNLVKNLALIDNENEYFLFTDIQEKKILNDIENSLAICDKKNFSIISLSSANKFFWNAWILPIYLRKNPVNIYLTQYITPWFVSKKVKIITIIHDISFNFFPQFIKWSDFIFLKILIPLSLKRANKIIGVSKFTRDEIIKYYKINSEKVDYFYNAFSDNFQQKISIEEIKMVKERYKLPDKFILYIGTMQPRKNIPFLLEAYAGIREKIPNIKLVLAGNKKARNFDKNIDRTIKKLKIEKDVFFTGFIYEKDKPALFKIAHVFCFPSLYEGFGIPILEAFISNVPVIVSDIPVFHEVAEKGAIFFNPSVLADLKEKLYTVSIDEETRKKLIQSGKTRILFFSWKKTAYKMTNIFNEIIKK